MKATRLAITAVATVCVGLALAACGPDEIDGAAGSSTAGAVASTGGGAQPAPTQSAAPIGAAKPTGVARPSGKPTGAKPTGVRPSGGAAPNQDCTAAAKQDLAGQVVVEATDNGYMTSVWMKAKPTKFVCGSDVPDDGYYESYGSPVVYTFSNDVKTYVLNGATPQPVSLDAFMKQQDDCLHNPSAVAAPGACFGNQYLITANGQNVITSITQAYHP
ncbi:hypothetical protein ACIGXM_25630 [Kitasatospora sp. NPDC052896]|uniref:hypothetical protein n=1 Tax=Kitasatospora sp. NPDC052896 TaxID=3364061 RepID=UPI0037C61C51